MQGIWIQSLVQEDATWFEATEPVHHNCWACTLEPGRHKYWACELQLLTPACLEPVLRSKGSHSNEKPAHCKEEKPRLTKAGESLRVATKTQRGQINKYSQKEVNRQATDWEEICVKCISVKHWGPEYVKNSSNSTIKRQTTQLRNGQITGTDTSQKKTYKRPTNTWKRVH